MSVLTFLKSEAGTEHPSPRRAKLVSENASVRERAKDTRNCFVQIGQISKHNISAEGYFPQGNRTMLSLVIF